jgi:Fe-S-cluster containining protein
MTLLQEGSTGLLRLSEESRQQLIKALEQPIDRPTLARRIHAIYDAFEIERAQRKPRCDQSGRCCRFEVFGHRLFVSTLELKLFESEVVGAQIERESDRPMPWDGLGCPYQVGGLCSVHAARPFGCRVYFCDVSSTDWQHQQYERFHAMIKSLHDELGIEYFYVEWREGLALLGVVPTANPAEDVVRRKLPVIQDR